MKDLDAILNESDSEDSSLGSDGEFNKSHKSFYSSSSSSSEEGKASASASGSYTKSPDPQKRDKSDPLSMGGKKEGSSPPHPLGSPSPMSGMSHTNASPKSSLSANTKNPKISEDEDDEFLARILDKRPQVIRSKAVHHGGAPRVSGSGSGPGSGSGSPIDIISTQDKTRKAIESDEGDSDMSSFDEERMNDILSESEGDEDKDWDQRSIGADQTPDNPLDVDFNPLDLIDTYENSSRMRKESQKSSYLGDYKKYSISGSKFMEYRQLSDIISKLQEAEYIKHRGRACCLHAHGNLGYIGNSQGIIRIFDLSDEKEYTPIVCKEVDGHAVQCIDVHKSGQFLVAGFRNGAILLWDLKKWITIKLITNAHSTAVIALKFLKNQKLSIISSDDSGNVSNIELTKSFFMSSAHSTYLVSNCYAFTFVPMFPYPLYKSPLDEISLVAIGASNSILIIMLEPTPKKLINFKKFATAKETALPYLDWGRGAIPGNPENTKPILAFAWDNILQLCILGDNVHNKDNFILNGYYQSEYEIQSLCFLGEGIIAIYSSCKQIKLLYTGNFVPGQYPDLPNKGDLVTATRLRQQLKQCELESDYKIDDELGCQMHQMDKSEKNFRMSYHKAIIVRKKQLILLGKRYITVGKLLGWNEYLEMQKDPGKFLGSLCVGLEIYLGEIKGFGDIPENKGYRETALRGYLKNYLTEGLNRMFNNPGAPSKKGGDAYSIAISMSIEFCLGIKAQDYLFTDIFHLFQEYSLQDIFIQNLEPYILSAKFRNHKLPKELMETLISHYLNKKSAQATATIERILLFVDLGECDVGHIGELCKIHKLYSAFIYIKTIRDDTDWEYIEPLMVMNAEFLKRTSQQVELSDLLKDKYNSTLEQSKLYLGYKILWYVKLCFKGRRFPMREDAQNRDINPNNWGSIVYVLIDWILIKQNLTVLLSFDISTVFDVLAMLFEYPQITKFITEGAYAQGSGRQITNYLQILDKIGEICIAEPEFKPAYNLFLARVSAQEKIQISAQLCMTTSKYLLTTTQRFYKNQNKYFHYEIEEVSKFILDMIKNCKALTLENMAQLIKSATDTQHYMVLVYLLEVKMQYAECFDTYLLCPKQTAQRKVFEWLDHMNKRLNKSGNEYQKLKEMIFEKLQILLQLNMSETAIVVDEWFKHQHEKVISKLKDQPNLQLKYVAKVIKDKEEYISTLLLKENINESNSEEYQQYKNLLIQHIQLLCNLNKDEVYKFVKKKYYPKDDCYKLCKENGIHIATAYLEKKMGNFSEALAIYEKIIGEYVDKMLNPQKKDDATYNKKRLIEMFEQSMKVCRKHSHFAQDERQELDLWWRLLDKLYNLWLEIYETVMEKSDFVQPKKQNRQVTIGHLLSDCIKSLLQHMEKTIPVPTILKRVTIENGELEFESFKDVFLKMISSYFHQEKIFHTARNILGNNMTSQFESVMHTYTKGITIRDNECELCHSYLKFEAMVNLIVFKCGHIYHSKCLKEKRYCLICADKEAENFSIGKMMARAEDIRRKPRSSTVTEDIRKQEEDISQLIAARTQGRGSSHEACLKRMKAFDKASHKSFMLFSNLHAH